MLSGLTFGLLDDIRAAPVASDDDRRLLQQLQDSALAAPWRLEDGFLLHRSRFFVPAHRDLRHQVLLLAHTAGHEGIQKTLHRLQANFYIPSDTTLVRDFVHSNNTCQRNKTKTLQPAGLLPAPRCAVLGVRRHLNGFHRRPAQGPWEGGHPHRH
jgi:hypothetical protein